MYASFEQNDWIFKYLQPNTQPVYQGSVKFSIPRYLQLTSKMEIIIQCSHFGSFGCNESAFTSLVPRCWLHSVSIQDYFHIVGFRCDQIGQFLNVVGQQILLQKEHKYFVTFWAILEMPFLSINCCVYFLRIF